MAENDIYNNKGRYEAFVKTYKTELLLEPEKSNIKQSWKRHYYCKNKENIGYFEPLFRKFEANDISYIRRLKLISVFKLILHVASKDLKDCVREDIDSIMAYMHTRNKSVKSKSDFVRDIKHIWKILFPEKDKEGRPDETIMPYVVRHLKGKIDKSKEKRRNDKLTFDEFKAIVNYFNNDVRMQAYLMLAFESLARPQELLFTQIKDYEFSDNWARVNISSHGKEGIGILQCIDSLSYVLKWLNAHPFNKDPNAFFFVNRVRGRIEQLRPENINKKIRQACFALNISKEVTCYSIKRNGVTYKRLQGASDLEIQHAARWTSTKQLKTYDLSDQDDAFKIALIKRGLITENVEDRFKQYIPQAKDCPFCGQKAGFSDEICPSCKHILDRNKIKGQLENNGKLQEELKGLKEEIGALKMGFNFVYDNPIIKQAFEEFLKSKLKKVET